MKDVSYILSKLECAYAQGSGGLTVAELVDNGAGYTLEKLHRALKAIENEKLVSVEVIPGRGVVYSIRVFDNIEELSREMPRRPNPTVIL